MKVTKEALVVWVYGATWSRVTKGEAAKVVDSFIVEIKESLINGDDVLLSGFGKFNVKDKRSRRGRNPQTGEEMILGARRVVTFKPSGILREKMNGGNHE